MDERGLKDRGIMSIDAQVLVIAFLAISLKLLLWAGETEGVEVEDELHRKHAFHLDGRQVQLRAQPHSAGPESLIGTTQISKEISDSRV
jgi:hypothetical protein